MSIALGPARGLCGGTCLLWVADMNQIGAKISAASHKPMHPVSCGATPSALVSSALTVEHFSAVRNAVHATVADAFTFKPMQLSAGEGLLLPAVSASLALLAIAMALLGKTPASQSMM